MSKTEALLGFTVVTVLDMYISLLSRGRTSPPWRTAPERDAPSGRAFRSLSLISLSPEGPALTAPVDENRQRRVDFRRARENVGVLIVVLSASGDLGEVVGDRGTAARDFRLVAGDLGEVARDHHSVAGDQGKVVGDHRLVAGDRGKVVRDLGSVACDLGKVSRDLRMVAGDCGRVPREIPI